MNKYDHIKYNCPFCASQNIYKYHQSDNGAQIFKCKSCKIQFMNPQYSDKSLADYYSTYIRDETKIEDQLIKAQTYCLSLVERLKPQKGSLLEIGSGNGYLLTIARERGWQATGHEIDCKNAKKLSERIGMDVLCGEFTKLKIENTFDVVMMLHVLEHLKNPVEHIQAVYCLMKSGGILFIALPNIQSRSALFKLALEKLGVKKKNIGAYYDTDHHLWYYTPLTIRNFLEHHGFDVIKIYSGSNVNINSHPLVNFIDEKIFSKIFWHSSMGVIARKNKC